MHQDWIQDVGEGRKHSAHGRIDILFRCQLQDKQRRQVAGVRLVRDAAPSILEPWGCILLPPLRTHLVQRGPSSSCPGRSPPLRVLRRVLHQVLVLHSVPTWCGTGSAASEGGGEREGDGLGRMALYQMA
ncbi:unnamed protein product [Prorocentrum cordatum]|uniref:Uncharacterized protein n=1 Tax=Prorocentrum cordatum TaxID=2364126 RepID=A0ABN9PG89_9DINO|nr:unnamed protein product [Polarella glacialis]